MKIEKASKLSDAHLIEYISNHGIPLKIARKHLKQVLVYDPISENRFSAIGFRNDEGGYQVRSAVYNGCIGYQCVAFIRGSNKETGRLHIFKDELDYLSIVSKNENKPLNDDTIILFSEDCLKLIPPYIKEIGYKKAYSWMRNDIEGKEAKRSLNNFLIENGVIHVPINKLYISYKNVNEWHRAKLNLTG